MRERGWERHKISQDFMPIVPIKAGFRLISLFPKSVNDTNRQERNAANESHERTLLILQLAIASF